jgi:TolB protein
LTALKAALALGTLLAALLAACGPGGESTPRPALLPIEPRPAAHPAGPAPTVAAQGVTLPGRLLFVKGGDLWLWQGESGRALTSSGDSFQPAWSPDGTRIAYIQRGESYSDLMLMPAEGGEPLRLTSGGSNNAPHSYERIYDTMWAFYPAFSPDGGEIAFVSQYGPPAGSPAADYHLALFSTPVGAGGGRTQLYADDSGHVSHPTYAPDGAMIVFADAPAGPGTPLLYRYIRASGTAEPLPGAPEQSYDPVFSPDGRWLAFAARDGGRTDVFAMPAGGGTPARLTSLGAARAPAFSPDGKLLAFLAIAPGANSFDLWVADLQQGEGGALRTVGPRQITHDMGIDADSGIAWGR